MVNVTSNYVDNSLIKFLILYMVPATLLMLKIRLFVVNFKCPSLGSFLFRLSRSFVSLSRGCHIRFLVVRLFCSPRLSTSQFRLSRCCIHQ